MAFDFQKLKSISKRLGGILVMDGDTPELVIIPYEKFAQNDEVRMTNDETPIPNNDDPLVDQLNKEILALKEEIHQKESSEAELI